MHPSRYTLALIPLLLIGIFLFQSESAHAAPRFPFPRNQAYRYGITTQLASPKGTEVQQTFTTWLGNYVDSGSHAFLFNNWSYHSSEQAYGMLAMVLMDNPVNNTQPKFDKLLAGYDKRLDSNGLMSWDISIRTSKQGGDTVEGYYAATDGDLDAALALLLAYKQWGEERYLIRARNLITNIWDHELDSTGNLLKPGDDWDLYKNPSYLNFAAFRLFSQVDKAHDWKRVEEASWKMLLANTSPANSPSRLPSDWCKADGTPVAGNRSKANFDYDAIRVPLRASLAWSWFGDARGFQVDSNIAAFSLNPAFGIQGRPDSIYSGYFLSGINSWYGHSATPFLLAFTGAGMVHSRFQAWVDTGFHRIQAWGNRSTYVSSLALLTVLHMSGNFNNLWDSTAFPVPVGIATTNPQRASIRIETSLQRIRLQLEGETTPEAVLVNLQGKAQSLPMHREGNALLLETPTLPRGVYLLRWSAGSRSGTERILH